MTSRVRVAVWVAALLVASCGPLADTGEPSGPSSGGSHSGGGGTPGTGGAVDLPAYCDCPEEDLDCFCKTYDCPTLEEVPAHYETMECVGRHGKGAKTLYDSGGDYRHQEWLYFRDGELVGYEKRFPVGPCGGEFVGAGERGCLTGNLCGENLGGAGGCPLVL